MLLLKVQEHAIINTLWTGFLQWTRWIQADETTYTASIHDFFVVSTKRNKNRKMLVLLSQSVLGDSYTPFHLRPTYSISRKTSVGLPWDPSKISLKDCYLWVIIYWKLSGEGTQECHSWTSALVRVQLTEPESIICTSHSKQIYNSPCVCLWPLVLPLLSQFPVFETSWFK